LWRETSEEIYISTILIVFDFRTQKNDCWSGYDRKGSH
jgi:hypothetical protein